MEHTSAIAPASLAELRSRLSAAHTALLSLDALLYQSQGSELAELMQLLDAVSTSSGGARLTVLAEALARGEVDASAVAARTWVAEHAPSTRQDSTHAMFAKLAIKQHASSTGSLAGQPIDPTDPENATSDTPDGPDTPLRQVCTAVASGAVGIRLGLATLNEAVRIAPHVKGGALPHVTQGFLQHGAAYGITEMRKIRIALLATLGTDGALDDEHEKLARAASLSSGQVQSGDLTEYRLLLTPTQAGILEAAIGPLAKPRPNPVTGERDLRPAGQRRAEALTTLCQRTMAVHADTRAHGPAGSSTALQVTMTLHDLLQGLRGAGKLTHSRAEGTFLSPSDVRRLACDAEIIPTVLGTRGEVLDIGVPARLFPRGQRRKIIHRDEGCTYPGCDAPPAWTEAHHIRHWVDGGQSHSGNGTLLCSHHHHVVHKRRLWARVTTQPDEHGRYVTWDLTPGSYDRALAALRSGHDPDAAHGTTLPRAS